MDSLELIENQNKGNNGSDKKDKNRATPLHSVNTFFQNLKI